MNEPLITIIVPCYNVEYYIRDCLESILSQDVRNIEILCLNDNSTDNTLQILKEYSNKDSRLRIINYTSNKGAGTLRNIGIKEALGEWLLFCDADDWYEKNFFSKLQNLTSYLPNKINIIEFNFNLSINKEHCKKADWLNRGISGIQKVKDVNVMLATSNWNKLFRKSFIQNYDLKNSEDNMSGEEIPLHICSFLLSNEFYYLNEVGYNWRINPTSISRNKYNKNFLPGVFKMTTFLEKEMKRLNIYNADTYNKICQTIYNWHIKEKKDLNLSYLKYYLTCNQYYKKWKLKRNKPIIFVIIEILTKKLYLKLQFK